MVKKPADERGVCCGEKMNVDETVSALFCAKCEKVGEQILRVNFTKEPPPLNTEPLYVKKKMQAFIGKKKYLAYQLFLQVKGMFIALEEFEPSIKGQWCFDFFLERILHFLLPLFGEAREILERSLLEKKKKKKK